MSNEEQPTASSFIVPESNSVIIVFDVSTFQLYLFLDVRKNLHKVPHVIWAAASRLKKQTDRCVTVVDRTTNFYLNLSRNGLIYPPVAFRQSINGKQASPEWQDRRLETENICHNPDGATECNYIYYISHRHGHYNFSVCLKCYHHYMDSGALHYLASLYLTINDIFMSTYINARHAHLGGHIHCQMCGHDCINWDHCLAPDLVDLDENYCLGFFNSNKCAPTRR